MNISDGSDAGNIGSFGVYKQPEGGPFSPHHFIVENLRFFGYFLLPDGTISIVSHSTGTSLETPSPHLKDFLVFDCQNVELQFTVGWMRNGTRRRNRRVIYFGMRELSILPQETKPTAEFVGVLALNLFALLRSAIVFAEPRNIGLIECPTSKCSRRFFDAYFVAQRLLSGGIPTVAGALDIQTLGHMMRIRSSDVEPSEVQQFMDTITS